jgi:hypothetical protein
MIPYILLSKECQPQKQKRLATPRNPQPVTVFVLEVLPRVLDWFNEPGFKTPKNP